MIDQERLGASPRSTAGIASDANAMRRQARARHCMQRAPGCIYNSSMYNAPMQDKRDLRIAKDLVAASAIPLVLAILDEGESYGYAIQKRIDELSGGELEWSAGMLYPLLHRLNRLGYVEASWDSPQGGRRRRYYRITPEGRGALSEQRRQWEVVSGALQNAWHSFQLVHPPLPGTVEA
jgi:PadR family transcriptional regulator